MKERSCYLGQKYPLTSDRVRDVCHGLGVAGPELAHPSSVPASKQQPSWSATGIVVCLRLSRAWTPEEDARMRRLAKVNSTEAAAALPKEISHALTELRGEPAGRRVCCRTC